MTLLKTPVRRNVCPLSCIAVIRRKKKKKYSRGGVETGVYHRKSLRVVCQIEGWVVWSLCVDH